MEDITLIPITKFKISKEKWLNTPIKYDKDMYIKDIIQQMGETTYQWISSKDDLECISDYVTFENDFINLIYDKYLDGRNK